MSVTFSKHRGGAGLLVTAAEPRVAPSYPQVFDVDSPPSLVTPSPLRTGLPLLHRPCYPLVERRCSVTFVSYRRASRSPCAQAKSPFAPCPWQETARLRFPCARLEVRPQRGPARPALRPQPPSPARRRPRFAPPRPRPRPKRGF